MAKKLDAGGKPSTWFPPGMTRRAPQSRKEEDEEEEEEEEEEEAETKEKEK